MGQNQSSRPLKILTKDEFTLIFRAKDALNEESEKFKIFDAF